jgi:outer membrane lipoprotein-sorting protein
MKKVLVCLCAFVVLTGGAVEKSRQKKVIAPELRAFVTSIDSLNSSIDHLQVSTEKLNKALQ